MALYETVMEEVIKHGYFGKVTEAGGRLGEQVAPALREFLAERGVEFVSYIVG